MALDRPVHIFTIPVARSFADALVSRLIALHGDDPLALASGMILLPSNRARDAVQAAFVRAGGAGLLLPRLVALGDADLGESAGLALDADLDEAPLPPAVEPLRRRLILSRLIIENWKMLNVPLAAPASLRLADALARVIDQLHFEEINPAALDTAAAEDLSRHWQVSMRHLQLLLDQWPAELEQRGLIDLAQRRNLMLGRVADRWRRQSPAPWVVAAGISVTAPAVARLLRVVADLRGGMLVLPGVDIAMPDEEWDALSPARIDALAPLLRGQRPFDTHPQYQFKLLLDRMGVARGEVADWPGASDAVTPADRSALARGLFVPSAVTAYPRVQVPPGAAAGIRTAEFADDAAEAQGIALLLRHALETPGRTAALITPDRQLAARVSSALARWGIAADDSAGRPLAQTPPGVLVRLVLAAATEGAAVPLMALLAHPLVRPGGDRAGWVAAVRALDLRLRGPGKPAGLAGIADWLRSEQAQLAEQQKQDPALDGLILWWDGAAARLAPMWALASGTAGAAPAQLLDGLVALADDLSDGEVWAGPAGRQLATLFDRWRLAAPDGPARLPPRAVARQLDDLLAGEGVRAPFGTHPRLFIWGLLEARLQRADLMVLGGLNEGGWPADTSPDPWLAPGIRRQLGLPSVHRAQGLAAHDFVTALGAGDVVVTRAQRQGLDPAVASRLWLRLTALAGPLAPARIDGVPLAALVAALDFPPGEPRRAAMPAIEVALGDRPNTVGLTSLDTLATDPFAFYAAHILKLRPLDRLGAPADGRWRGSRVHALLDHWLRHGADPVALDTAIRALAADPALGAIEAAGWHARIAPALRWVASELAANHAAGRIALGSEVKGRWTVGGITIKAKADRIDQTAAGLVVVDYKTGGVPSPGDIARGRALQMGLLAAMIENGAFDGLPGLPPTEAEYWLLKPNDSKTAGGHVDRPYKGRGSVKSFAALVESARGGLFELTRAYLTGTAPFTPGEKTRGDYDHLARRDEWIGRFHQEHGE